MLDVKKLISKISQRLNAIGTTYTASWAATSTSGTGNRVTNNIVLPAGTYAVSLRIPIASQSAALYFGLSVDSIKYGASYMNQGIGTYIVTLTQETTIYGVTGMSNPTNYSYTERGYLKAVRIA